MIEAKFAPAEEKESHAASAKQGRRVSAPGMLEPSLVKLSYRERRAKEASEASSAPDAIAIAPPVKDAVRGNEAPTAPAGSATDATLGDATPTAPAASAIDATDATLGDATPVAPDASTLPATRLVGSKLSDEEEE